MGQEFSVFAETTYKQKYAHSSKETWGDIARRVVTNVMGAVDAPSDMVQELVEQRKFMPGGRYLYASGRDYHQTQNCALFRAGDSREEWAELMEKITVTLMSGAGIGVVYSDLREQGAPIKRTGGESTGPLALMQMVNEAGRHIMQGGSRRSAIWAGLHWNHPDIHNFIRLKDWEPELRALKAKDFNFPCTMDMTNISVILDDEFFEAYHNKYHSQHTLAHSVYWTTVKQMLQTSEPGFSVDCGENTGENLRNAPVSGNTYVLLQDGYTRVGDIVGEEVTVWTGKQWTSTVFTKTFENTSVVRVNMTGGKSITCDPFHEFLVERWAGRGRKRRRLIRIERLPARNLQKGDILHTSLSVSPGSSPYNKDEWYALGYIYGDGSFHRRYPRAEITFCSPESKECLSRFPTEMLTSVTECDSRGYTRAYTTNHPLFDRREKSVFPEDVYSAPPECRASFAAGLFDSDGNWGAEQSSLRLASRHRGFLVGVRRLLESLKIRSVVVPGGVSTYGKKPGWLLRVVTDDVEAFRSFVPTLRVAPDEGVCSYRPHRVKVLSVEDAGREDVFCCDVGVEEHSFQAEGVIISNCTEVSSRDDGDICNLGSINMARVDSLEEMQHSTRLATAFLLAGTVYSLVPFPDVDRVRQKNRRLGLGLMGLHEWLLKRGKKYGPDDELGTYLETYRLYSNQAAAEFSDKWDLTRPIKKRAIAPTGTIGIVAETTTGIEPVFCTAYKRRYLKGNTWHYQYVVEPIAKRLIEGGMDPDDIEDAYTIDTRTRLEFQAWVQQYVDHGISSTINLPAWGTERNNNLTVEQYGNLFLEYLPRLRGLTVYADGSRGGQPLTPVPYEEAMRHVGAEFVEESADICKISGRGGGCGE